MVRKLVFLLMFLSVAVPKEVLANTETIRIFSRGDKNALYAIKMLELGLTKAGVSYRLDVTNEALSAARLRTELVEDRVDVTWASTTAETEAESIPIRVPLYKGLLGFRVLLVHKDNVNMFQGVRSLDDLKRFSLGQGMGWADSEILKANGLNVVLAARYEGLFYMTDGGRFDAYPRGVHEPWAEMAARPDLELAVEPHLLLSYPSPFYLFINPKRHRLAAEIERGLMLAIEDGDFDKVFYADPTVQTVLERANVKGRRVIRLSNPHLPAKTPLSNPKLWVEATDL